MFLQHLLNGITIGGSYALIALGYTLVYGVLKLINFAHGEVYMVGAMSGYYAAHALGAGHLRILGRHLLLNALPVIITLLVVIGASALARFWYMHGYWNEGRAVKIPNDAFATQVVKADAGGVFAYSVPRAGWWGFAALVPGQEKMKAPNGKLVDVELGGVIWVRAVDMK